MRKALIIFILTTNILLHAAADVALKAYPAFQIANRGFVRLTLTIEPDARNRSYCLFYEGSNSGSQCRELDGRAARTRWVELKDLPPGEYQAELVVTRNDGSVIRSVAVKWAVLDGVPQG